MKRNYKKLICLALVMVMIIGSMSAFAYSGWKELLGGAGVSIYFGDNTGNGNSFSTSKVCYGSAFANSISSGDLYLTLYANGYNNTSVRCPNNATWRIVSLTTTYFATWRGDLYTANGQTGGWGYGSIGSTGYVY